MIEGLEHLRPSLGESARQTCRVYLPSYEENHFKLDGLSLGQAIDGLEVRVTASR